MMNHRSRVRRDAEGARVANTEGTEHRVQRIVAALGKRGLWLAVCGGALLGATAAWVNVAGPVVAFHRVPLTAGTNEVLITLAPLPVIATGEAPTVAEDFGTQLAEGDRVELIDAVASAVPAEAGEAAETAATTPVESGQVYRVTVGADGELVLTGLVVWEDGR